MNLTITGIDRSTSGSCIAAILNAGHELGLLWKCDPGRHKRFVDVDWLRSVTNCCSGKYSLHVYGADTRKHLMETSMSSMLREFQRIKFVGKVTDAELAAACDRFPRHTIITQWQDGNPTDSRFDNHAIVTDIYVNLPTTRKVGHRYSGGLNLANELAVIASIASPGWWLEIGPALRTNEDWFSWDLAKAAMATFKAFKDSRQPIRVESPNTTISGTASVTWS